MSRSFLARTLCAGVALVGLWSATAYGEEVPAELALTVMLKVLTYDAAFENRPKEGFVVLIPYLPKDEEPAKQLAKIAEGLDQKTIVGRPLKFELVPAESVPARLGQPNLAAVLLSAAIPSATVKELVPKVSAVKAYSLCLDPARVDDGVMLSVASVNGHPQPVLNVKTTKAIGAEFKPAVLKVARTVQ